MPPNRKTIRTALLLIAFGLGASSVTASIREIHVSSPSLGDQERGQSASLTDGSVAYVWEDQQGDDSRILFAVLDPTVLGLSAPRRVDASQSGYQTSPCVDALPNGGFVVAWAMRSPPPDNDYNVYAQAFSSRGQAIFATALQVHQTTSGAQLDPAVVALPNSGFVVAYASQQGRDQDVYLRQFDSRGRPSGPETSPHDLDEFPFSGDEGDPDLCAMPDRGYLLAFENRFQESLHGIRYDPNGDAVPLSPDQPTSFIARLDPRPLSTAIQNWAPKVSAFPNGGFVLAYNEDSIYPAFHDRSVAFRILDSLADDPESGVRVEPHPGHHHHPDVQVLTENTFAFLWQTDPATNAVAGSEFYWQTWVQIFRRDGTPQTPPFPAAANQDYTRRQGHLSARGDGGWVMSWESRHQDGDGLGMYSRLVAPLLPTAGQLSIQALSDGGLPGVRVNFHGPPLECYELQSTTNFQAWTTLLQTNPVSGQFQYTQPANSLPANQSYRVERKLFP